MVGVEVTEFLALLALLLEGDMIGSGIMKKIKFPTIIGFRLISKPYNTSEMMQCLQTQR